MSFSREHLKDLRKRAGLSQIELADKAGVPLRSLQTWEIGYRKPKVEALVKLAVALNVPLEELLGGKGRT